MAVILVVDDREVNRQFMATLLGYIGHQVLTAEDGEQALSLVAATRPDLIISDILMPTMDGEELVTRLRADPALATVPVIFWTATFRTRDAQLLAARCGVEHILSKPTEPEEVIRVVAASLGVPPPELPNELASEAPTPSHLAGLTELQEQLAAVFELGLGLASRRGGMGELTDSLRAAFSELRGVGGRLAALVELGFELASARDRVALLSAFGRAARLVLGARRYGVCMLDATAASFPNGEPVQTTLAPAPALDPADRERLASAASRSTWMPSPGRPLGLPPAHPAVHALLTVPLRTAHTSLGWAYFADKLGDQPFSEDDQRLAQTLASQLALAWDRARSLDDLAQREARLAVEIAERQRSEAAAREAADRYRAIFEGALEGIFQTSLDGRVLTANPAIAELLGYPDAATLLAEVRDIGTQVYCRRQDRERILAALVRDAKASGVEIELRRRDGSQAWFRGNYRLVCDDDGAPSYVEGSLVDVSREKEAQERLRATAEQYRVLFEGNPLPMWVYDLDSLGILAVNEAAIRHYGWTRQEFLGLTLADLRPPEELPLLAANIAALRAGEDDPAARTGTWRHRRKDGSLIDVEVTGSPIAFGEHRARLVLALDVTEKKALGAQLARAQKLEAIGRLAGGVAHDFNNLLTIIYGLVELAQAKMGRGELAVRELTQIQATAERCATLTRHLLAFGRRQVMQPRLVDPASVLGALERLLRPLIGEDIALGLDVRSRRMVRVDPSQLEQVVVNLVINARDAMPTGGRIELVTADLALSAEAAGEGLPAGDYVELIVRDSGTGMAPEVLEHLFEPFFTTKDASRGSGLGLSTAYGIVRQSGGTIEVESAPGDGSTFRVLLPAVDGETIGSLPQPPRPTRGGNETILLVEDDPLVRNVTAEVLGDAGYRVLATSRGSEAIATAAGAEPIDLLLTDVVLPELSGPQVATVIRRQRPGIAVLFVSGYTPDDALRHGIAADTELLAKPYTRATLLERVRGQLDRRASGRGEPEP